MREVLGELLDKLRDVTWRWLDVKDLCFEKCVASLERCLFLRWSVVPPAPPLFPLSRPFSSLLDHIHVGPFSGRGPRMS